MPSNPGGAWSYGWKSTLDGAFTLYARHGFELQDGGGQWDYWLKPGGGASAVYHNSGTTTITNNGGQGVYPPGTVVIDGGYEGNADNYCVIRLTIPADHSTTMHQAAAMPAATTAATSSDRPREVGLDISCLSLPFVLASSAFCLKRSSAIQ